MGVVEPQKNPTNVSFGGYTGHRKQEYVQRRLEYRLKVAERIASLSARFVNCPPEGLSEAIRKALAELGELLESDRCYLVRVTGSSTVGDMKVTHGWCKEGVCNRFLALEYSEIAAQALDGKVVRIEDVGSWSTGNAGSSDSVVCLPLVHMSETVGFLGFDSSRTLPLWGDFTVSLLRIAADLFIGAMERKRAERALRAMQFAVDKAADSVLWISKDARIYYTNDSACRSLGYSPSELLGLTVYDIAPSVDRTSWPDRWNEVKEWGSLTYESEHIRKDGTLFPVEITLNYFSFEGKEFHCVIARNISERRRTQAALYESERKFKSAFEYTAVGMALLTTEGRFVQANRALSEFLGTKKERLSGRPICNYLINRDKIFDDSSFAALLLGECENIHTEASFRATSGEERLGSVSASVVYDHFGNPLHVIIQLQDVTEQRAVEAQLRRERSFFRKVIDLNPNFIFSKDRNGKFVLVNQAVADVYGTSVQQLIGKRDADFDSKPEEVEHFRKIDLEVMDTLTQKFIPEECITDSTGQIRWLQTVKLPIVGENGRADQVLGVATDITERKRFEEEQRRLLAQMQLSQKWESLGLLAGGIAHDFNNLLMGIMGNAGLAAMDLSENSAVQERISRIGIAAKRASELTNQLLAYSGRGKFVIDVVDLSQVVREMAALLETIICKKAKVSYEYSPIPVPIRSDISQLRQVVMNLITNASDALEDRSGEINISTGLIMADEEYLSTMLLPDEIVPGHYGYISVSDSGCGMEPAVLERIFDPFFTTKFTGRGLGLAAVLGIVKSHHGNIFVDSRPGEGTAFRVLFPAAEAVPEIVVRRATDHSHRCLGTGLFLVVDDDEHCRSTASDIVSAVGFEVVPAFDGVDALEKFSKRPSEFAGVLLDMTMPRMDGEETLNCIDQIRSTIPVILTSGYTEQEASERFQNRELLWFIQKPYNPSQLWEKLSQITTDKKLEI